MIEPSSPKPPRKAKSTPYIPSWPASHSPTKAFTQHSKLRLFASIIAVNFLLIILPLHTFLRPAAHQAPVSQCERGTVFVYNVPPHFNLDLIDRSLYSNDGFGNPTAASFSSSIPPNFTTSWFHTEQFALEVIFHRRMERHPCRTESPGNATAFYFPFFPGMAVARNLLRKNATHEELDRVCNSAMEWLGKQRHFGRFQGRDHFIVFSRITWDFRRGNLSDWGSSCIYHPKMENITRLLIERHPWDEMDVGMPYPTGFHPGSQLVLSRWQEFVRSKPRKALFSFVGGPRKKYPNDFRAVLLDQCKKNSDRCLSVDCSNGKCGKDSSPTLDAFLDSEFCLQPRGDSFTRKSVFDCLVAGAIPVFFWKRTAYVQYQWYLPHEPESFSVFIHRTRVVNGSVNIREALEGIGGTRKQEMRNKVVEMIPKIVYGKGQGFSDAIDVAVDEILKRFRKERFVN